jgi:Spy/CpxP family protein refolding chaperone
LSWRRVLGVGLAWAVATTGASAQERTQRAPGGQGEAFRMVDAYVIANIQESLDLSDEQFVNIVLLVKGLQKERRQLIQGRGRALRDMRRLLRSGTATEEEIEEALAAFKALEVDGPRRVREKREALDAELTPVQQAKLRVFEVEVEHRIREMSRRARRQRTPQGQNNP